MRYRRLGRTEIPVSEIVFGGGYVGGLLILHDDHTRRRALARALAAGVNWIDTAPAYGRGRSEEALGWLLGEVESEPHLSNPHVSTKVRVDPEKVDDCLVHVTRSAEQSLARLRRDSVDLLQLHNPLGGRAEGGQLSATDLLRPGGVLDALEHVREQGLTRFIGITALGDPRAVRAVVASGRVDTAQVYYNLLNPSAGRSMPPRWRGHDFSGVMQACAAADVGIMAIRVFAAGVLASNTRTGREAVLTRDSAIAVEEARAGAVHEVLSHLSPAEAALRFVLANREVACAVVGLSEPAQMDEALAAAARGPLPEADLSRLEPLYESNFGL